MIRSLDNADLFALLEHEGGRLLYDGPEGGVVLSAGGGTVMTDLTDGADARRVLGALALRGVETAVVKSEAAREAACEIFGLCGGCERCAQWVYTAQTLPAPGKEDIRPLRPEHAQEAASHYGLFDDGGAYIAERIRAGRMWGIFEEDRLAGFIGTHTEGSMGMLEVLPDYRRRGYGIALERFLIAWQLSQGWIPFGHVIDGNEASAHLQRKAGLTRAGLPAIWVF